MVSVSVLRPHLSGVSDRGLPGSRSPAGEGAGSGSVAVGVELRGRLAAAGSAGPLDEQDPGVLHGPGRGAKGSQDEKRKGDGESPRPGAGERWDFGERQGEQGRSWRGCWSDIRGPRRLGRGKGARGVSDSVAVAGPLESVGAVDAVSELEGGKGRADRRD